MKLLSSGACAFREVVEITQVRAPTHPHWESVVSNRGPIVIDWPKPMRTPPSGLTTLIGEQHASLHVL